MSKITKQQKVDTLAVMKPGVSYLSKELADITGASSPRVAKILSKMHEDGAATREKHFDAWVYTRAADDPYATTTEHLRINAYLAGISNTAPPPRPTWRVR